MKETTDPNPIVEALRNFYKDHYNGQAPKDEELENVARQYAGREMDMWRTLYRDHYAGKAPADDVLKEVVVKYPNTFAQKKKEPGISSGSATTAAATSSSKNLDIPIIDPNDAFRSEMGAYRTSINKAYEEKIDRLYEDLKGGVINQEQYDEAQKKYEEEREKDLTLVEWQEAEGPQPDKVYEGWDQLKDKYRPWFPTQRFRTYEEAAKKMPDQKVIVSFVDHVDDLVASEMGVSRDEARARMKMAYDGSSENTMSYADLLKLRQMVVEKNRAAIVQKFPGLGQKAVDAYVKADPMAFEKDVSDPNNPYAKLRFGLIDNYLDQNYSHLSKKDRNMLRQDLLDDMMQRPLYEKAKKKTEEVMAQKGLTAPADAVKQYQAEVEGIIEDYSNSVKTTRENIVNLQKETQVNYENQAKELQAALEAKVRERANTLQQLINEGKIELDVANQELTALQNEADTEMKGLFNRFSEDLAKSQRQLIQQAEQEKARVSSGVAGVLKKYNLKEEDGMVMATDAYLEEYNNLFKENVRQEQLNKLVAQQEAYDNMSFEQKISSALALGYMDMFESVGGGLRWLGAYEAGDYLSDLAAAENTETPQPMFGTFQVEDMGDPDWWIAKGIRLLPTTLNLMAVGGGLMGATGSLAGAAGATQGLRTATGAVVGGLGSRALESFMEAGSTFNSMIEKGFTSEEAAAGAAEVYRGNMQLVMSDIFQLALNFGHVPIKLAPGVYGKVQKAVGTGAANFFTEGGEEVYQGYLQTHAENPVVAFMEYARSPEGIEAGLLGGITGVAMTAMSAGGSEMAKNAAVHKLLTGFEGAEKANIEDVQKRYMQVVNTINGLREKGVLNAGEYEDAIIAAKDTFENVSAAMAGDIPLDWRSMAHQEYSALASRVGKMRRKAAAEKNPDRKRIYDQAIGAMEARMNNLINDPKSPMYYIDGVSVLEKDFVALLNDAGFRKFVPASKFRVENDLPMMALAAQATGDVELSRQVAEEFIQSTEEVNTVQEAIQYLDEKIKTAGTKRNAKDTVDRYTAMRDVFMFLDDQNQRPGKYREMVASGEFDARMQEMNEQEAVKEFEILIQELEKEGADASEIEAVKKKYSHLDERVDRAVSEEYLGPEEKAVAQEGMKQDDFESAFENAIVDIDSIKESHPDLHFELSGMMASGEEVPAEMKRAYMEALKPEVQPAAATTPADPGRQRTAVDDFVELTDSEPGWFEYLQDNHPELADEYLNQSQGDPNFLPSEEFAAEINEALGQESFEYEDAEDTGYGKTTVYRGTGDNVTNQENEAILWVSEDPEIAKKYAGKNGKIEEMTVDEPVNPFRFPYKSDKTRAKASDIGQLLLNDLADKVESGELSEDQIDPISKEVALFEEKAGENPEEYLTKVNKPGAAIHLTNALQMMGYDAIVQAEKPLGGGILKDGLGLFKVKISPEMVEGSLSEVTPTEMEVIDARIAELKDEVKEGVKKWFNMGLTPFNEQKMIDDARFYMNMVELAYLHIKKGIKTLPDFASAMGLRIDENLRNVWAAAKELYNNRTESVITMSGNLSAFDAFREFFQDKDIAIKRLQEELQELGVDIDDASDVYTMRELFVSRVDREIQLFRRKMIGIDPADKGAKAINKNSFVGRLMEAFPENGNIMDEMALYMYAKHAIAFNARVKELRENQRDQKLRELEDKRDNAPTASAASNYQNQIDSILAGEEMIVITNGSGMRNDQAQAIIDYYETQPDFAQFETFVKEFRKEVIDARIDMLEAAGMIKPEQAEAFRKGTKNGSNVIFEHYVPLKVKNEAYFADFDPTSLGVDRPGIVKSIKGAARFTFLDRNNPVAQALSDMEGTIKDIQANEVKKGLYNLMKAQPDSTFWDVVPSRAVVTVNEIGELESFNDLVSRQIKENSVTVMIDGKLKYLYFAPQLDEKSKQMVKNPVLRALSSNPFLDEGFYLSKILGAARAFISFRRNLITTYNIAFGFPNFTRDIQEALGNIETVKDDLGLKKIRGKFLANVAPAMKVIAQSPAAGTSKMAKYWDEAQENGMSMSWARYMQNDAMVEKYEQDVAKYHKNQGRAGLPIRAGKFILQHILFVNDVMENATRLALYAALRDAGVSPQQAASAGKNITLNFEKKGRATNVINAFWLFANAGIQGTARGSKLLIHRKAGRYVLNKRGLALGLSISAFGFFNRMLLDWFTDDDELLSEFDKANNTFMFNPVDPSKPLKMPKPYSLLRFFMNFGENLYDTIAGKTTFARGMLASNMDVIHQFVDPIGGASENRVSAWSPELLTIFVEWQMNQKWNGTPFHFKDHGDPASEKYTKQTSPWLIWATEKLNDATDVAGHGHGYLSFSPALIEYSIQQLGGGVMTESIRLEKLIQNSAQGKATELSGIPIVRRFVTDLNEDEKIAVRKLYEITKRSAKTGISNEEIQTARKAYQIVKKGKYIDPKTLSRIRSDFKKKWGQGLTAKK